MSLLFLLSALFFFLRFSSISGLTSFRYEGFKGVNLTLQGAATITPDGVLLLSSDSNGGQAFYPTPISFKNSSNSVYPFKCKFVFAVISGYEMHSGQEIAFIVSPTMDLNHSESNIGGLKFVFNAYDNEAGYFSNNGTETNAPMHMMFQKDTRNVISVNYSDNFFIADMNSNDRNRPFGTLGPVPASISFINEEMYVGFSATTGSSYYQLLGWSFEVNGTLEDLRDTKLPQIFPMPKPKTLPESIIIVIAVLATTSLPLCGLIIAWYVNRKLKFSEVIDGWEEEYNYISHRFKYKDLYMATKGFRDTELLGRGGFGKVYKGVMPGSKTEIALKKISFYSKYGTKQFIAEVVSLGRLRHRNLVPLRGYCRRKEELILVYEYMPNGSLDKFIRGTSTSMISWLERFEIIKGVASGILYLHEEWEQVVIHRDIKPANVLLDANLNPRLGDFGLARFHTHGSDPSTTKVVGTPGYLAPEYMKTCKPTKSSDIYGFGILMLEVASGRRPIRPNASDETAVLVNWVHSLWMKNQLLDAMDPNLGWAYSTEEAEFVLKLGLFCCHSRPEIRPTVRHISGYFEDPSTFPEAQFASAMKLGFSEGDNAFQSPISMEASAAITISHSLAFGGR